MKQPPSDKGKNENILCHSGRGETAALLFKVNKEADAFSYSVTWKNQLRDNFKFTGTSVKFVFREKGENELE